ncbi:hypothetical protein AWENTII_002604 [Aspergillus wentii]
MLRSKPPIGVGAGEPLIGALNHFSLLFSFGSFFLFFSFFFFLPIFFFGLLRILVALLGSARFAPPAQRSSPAAKEHSADTPPGRNRNSAQGRPPAPDWV